MPKATFSSILLVLVTMGPAPALAQSTPSRACEPPTSLPNPPSIDDAMLAPAPPPKRVLASWDEGIAYLRSRSTDLRIALAQALQAEAQTRIALAAYLPSINGNGFYTHQLLTNPAPGGQAFSGVGFSTSARVPIPDTFTGNIVLQQTLVNVQAFDAISIDELSEDAAKLTVEDEKRTLALSIANQIVAVVTAEREAEINRVGLKVALEQLHITIRKQALGAANGLDVVRAQQNAANARATLVTGDESLRQAREALGLALGVPEEMGVSPNVNIDGLAQSAMASCHRVPLDDRADIAAARTRFEVAKRNLRNVAFQFLPTVGMDSTLAGSSVASTGYPNPTWNIRGILSLPIWDGGVRYGQLRNARAAEDIAAQQLEALRRQATIQLEQAQRQLIVAETSDKVARQQRDLAAQNDIMTQTAYMAGQGTSLELVTASEAHRQAELNVALQDFSVVKARVLAMLALATCPW
ncbi:MAG: TolC family protein [Myxococcota bacterium]|nr:TolC family protein [Myxococcota bacterium]